MRLLILGASGTIGKFLLPQAQLLGHEVTVLVRDPSKLKYKPTRVIVGDALDPVAIDKALEGQQAVIYALGTLSQPAFFSTSTQLLIEAMRRHNVPRLIAITGIGAGDSKGHGSVYDNIIYPLFTEKIYADKDIQQRLIRESNLEWVIVRPASFTNGPLGDRLRATDQLEGVTISSISRQDVAAFTLDQLTSNRWLHRTPLVGY
ncbi:MAG: SDR family oxidoreductase [Acidobacteria bacterium]|nr:SDR family oxidoreductase [Acidobacteriota bacterium]